MKLIIPETLISKISYINSQINTVEWMGVFVYKTKGKFPTDSFVMEAVDILLMAKGTQAEVGYIADINLIQDLDDLGIEEMSRGLVHLLQSAFKK